MIKNDIYLKFRSESALKRIMDRKNTGQIMVGFKLERLQKVKLSAFTVSLKVTCARVHHRYLIRTRIKVSSLPICHVRISLNSLLFSVIKNASQYSNSCHRATERDRTGDGLP